MPHFLPGTIFGPRMPDRGNEAHMPDRGRSHTEIAIIGAGFSGLGMAIRLRREGFNDFVILDSAGDVGGTWWWNTYPGCRCDTPSRLYSYAFAPNPDWSETYARQPEILAYLRSCAQRENILPYIRFHTEVTAAAWDESRNLWVLDTTGGQLTATSVVNATGALSEPKYPNIPGLETFTGTSFHSARWNHDYDLTDKRVAVIGTGASAVQIVPEIAPITAQLDVYQRSPAWVPPHTGRATAALERRLLRKIPAAQRLPRAEVYYQRELYALGWTRWRQPVTALEAICRAHLRRQVRDPAVRRKLTPDYRLGCKRPTPSNTYLRMFNRTNVELVTDGIVEVRPHSIVTADGTERDVDAVIFATGFHVTDSPMLTRIRGRDGRTLGEVFDGSPRAYLGTTIDGFPNTYTLLGPNTGNLTTSVVLMVESQIDYVLACLSSMREKNLASIEPTPQAVADHTERVRELSKDSVWLTGGCQSWYLDRNGHNSTLWPDFSWRFDELTRAFQPKDHIMTSRAPVTERPARIAGIRTRVIELDGEGPAFVFLHGLTDCADFWHPTLARLSAAGRRAVAVDLPGFGVADPLRAGPVLPQLDTFVEALVSDVAHRTGAKVILVGHSMGACAALRFAQRRPQQLVGVVAAPPVGFDAPWLSLLSGVGKSPAVRRPLRSVELLPASVRRRVIAALWKTVALNQRTSATTEFLAAYTGYFESRIDRYLDATVRFLAEIPRAYEIEQIRHPLLLVWGDKDRLAKPSSAARILATVPDSRLELLPGVGHCPAIEAPDRIAQALLAFTADLDAATITEGAQL